MNCCVCLGCFSTGNLEFWGVNSPPPQKIAGINTGKLASFIRKRNGDLNIFLQQKNYETRKNM